MTSIYLVRHGETDYNTALRLQGSSDIPLNEKGKKQAAYARDYFKRTQFDAILASPLSRARETVEIINETQNSKITTLNDLKEQSFGSFEGEHIENIRLRYPEGDLPGAETPEEMSERAKNVIEHIDRCHKDETILISAHSRIIKSILSLFSSEVHIVFTKLEHCSVSILESDGELYEMTELNIQTR